ncbi:hypothetical protein CJ030_MR4G009215 [Morella rubra]|uniref:Uncharacterized protein n=1 Tax=Morella rubra TaxID=262757 RepID=A0A6A1VSA0_9ROSI|nr:hypothetical protein CJ030_MR4G009215 [Morella rubra]
MLFILLVNNNMATLNAKVNDRGQTPLHIAVAKGHVHIVENLVGLMPEKDLEILDDSGMTAMALALGDTRMIPMPLLSPPKIDSEIAVPPSGVVEFQQIGRLTVILQIRSIRLSQILHRIMLQFELSTALKNSRRMQAENDQTSQEAIVAPDITEKTKQGIASTAK